MSRKNYVKYSKMNKEENNEVVLDKTSFEEETVIEDMDIITEEKNIVQNDDIEENIQEALKEETRTGVVSGCAKLRVRKEASTEAGVYGTIEEGTELTVSITHSTEEFYKVNTIIHGTLISGYCMKKFIELK